MNTPSEKFSIILTAENLKLGSDQAATFRQVVDPAYRDLKFAGDSYGPSSSSGPT